MPGDGLEPELLTILFRLDGQNSLFPHRRMFFVTTLSFVGFHVQHVFYIITYGFLFYNLPNFVVRCVCFTGKVGVSPANFTFHRQTSLSPAKSANVTHACKNPGLVTFAIGMKFGVRQNSSRLSYCEELKAPQKHKNQTLNPNP